MFDIPGKGPLAGDWAAPLDVLQGFQPCYQSQQRTPETKRKICQIVHTTVQMNYCAVSLSLKTNVITKQTRQLRRNGV